MSSNVSQPLPHWHLFGHELPPMGRIQELDALRGLAALAVVIFHYTVMYPRFYERPIPTFQMTTGHYGVQLFFIISGFVIALTLVRTPKLSDFLVSRSSRLYPSYIPAVILTAAVMFIAPKPGWDLSLTDVVINLTMLQDFVGIPLVDGVYWTLACEITFYVIAFLLLGTPLVRWHMPLLLLWLTLMNLAIWLEAHGANYGLPEIPWLVQKFTLLNWGHFFVIGMGFFSLFAWGVNRSAITLITLALLTQWHAGSVEESFYTAAFAGIFFLFISGKLKWLAKRPLIWLGTISYALYLLHENIGFALLQALEGVGVTYWLAVAITGTVSISIAALVTYKVERPLANYIKKRWKTRKQRSS